MCLADHESQFISCKVPRLQQLHQTCPIRMAALFKTVQDYQTLLDDVEIVWWGLYGDESIDCFVTFRARRKFLINVLDSLKCVPTGLPLIQMVTMSLMKETSTFDRA